jgi:hypothetical protein
VERCKWKATSGCLHSWNLTRETSYDHWGRSRTEDSCLARWS